jgi:hypothetical protein
MKTFILSIALFSFFHLTASPPSELEKIANNHVANGNYMEALKIYTRIVERDTTNADASYGAGVCILNIATQKKGAITYLERAMRNGCKKPDLFYFLGLAYHINLQYDYALELFYAYKEKEEGSFLGSINRQIETVKNAKKIAEAPINVEFENIGLSINSKYPDYYPFITPDESFIAFTSRRRKNINAKLEFDGFYSSDIWISKVKDGEFTAAENAGRNINTGLDEQVVGLSSNGDKMFIYIDHIKEYGDIYYSNFINDNYEPKTKFDRVINSDAFESSASISADGNTLFFSSSRDGGFGGKDLYMVRKLPTGQWANPQNLGPTINTAYDEDFPNLFYDGNTLYFASVGHNSIGGYDIFKSKWDPEKNTWSIPENIGYPVNTPEHNLTISFTSDQRHAYISTWRPDSEGDLDIYRITFKDLDPRQTVIKAKIVKANSETILKEGFITILNNRTQEEVGNYIPDPKNGNIVIALEPGSYNLMIDVEGYDPVMEDIIIKGKSDFQDFLLRKFVVGAQ